MKPKVTEMRFAPASLSPFNYIITHLIVYQIFNRPRSAKRNMRCAESTLPYTNETAKGYRGGGLSKTAKRNRAPNLIRCRRRIKVV